ncbi:MAG: DUF5110 domain-containing protein, partial [Clostridia bacterium]|nr:DUF5110 domain-containing protein [Clostridia bacterium]
AAGNNGSFTLYEDDGETMNYQKEDFCTSEFNLAWGENRAVFTKLKSAGNLAYIPNNRTYTLVFKGFSAKCAFFLNGESILACYNEKTHEYEVSVPNVTGADGFEVTVESDQGLIYENLASTDKILDIITKAQTDLAKKDRLYQSVTAILQKTKTDFSELVSDETDQTPQAVIEQLKLLGYKE